MKTTAQNQTISNEAAPDLPVDHTDRKKSRPAVRRPTPPVLADVALIDGPTCAAAACMALSGWHELVRTHQAPQPVIRQPRFTRWSLAQVRAWLSERATQGPDAVSSQRVTEKAKKASLKAAEKRTTRAAE